ncbi:MAG: S53 family peptidase [Actinomycetota bacterium]|nr:S53 family peptidase [Actinomycetota bacterium]
MKRTIVILTLVGALVFACSGMVLAQSAVSGDQTASGGQSYTLPANVERVCHRPADPEKAACLALRRNDIGRGAHPKATVSYQGGYTPSELQSAYELNDPGIQAGGSGKTIAIVDAYDNPSALQDLEVYRQQFGLAAGPTVTKMNQSGQVIETLDTTTGTISKGPGAAPSPSVGWGQEIALDLDMASAICPTCKILLVEANSNSLADLGAAVNKAAQQNVNSISNSYGANEFLGETSFQSYYDHPGIAITVSSGDNGYGVEFPAASKFVTAVGGTSLTHSSTARGWSENVWSGAGSGCSAYIAKPSWQRDKGCTNRTVADVSAVADPNTGVAVYDSYGSTGGANWYVFGGTSVSAPIIASVYALAGNTINYGEYPYNHASALYDVVSGSNGRCSNRKTASKAYLCTGGAGYDGPSGLGTPNGVGAF